MTIGLLQLIIKIPGSNSLKEKRRVLHSLRDKLRDKYNISITEIEDQDKWQKSTLAIAKVDQERKMIDTSFGNIVDYIRNSNSVEILDYQIELF
ncbi:MAG: DUF503 domain-containing protein [Candidatus Omnitrophica bacterium]|nr:DUF503 domain-containing protein [Candidatus Omnitrophota bacterium]